MSQNVGHVQPEKTVEDQSLPQKELGTLAGVRFQPAGKAYHFLVPQDLRLEVGDWVVVETVYGEQVGQVVQLTTDPDHRDPSSSELRDVLRRATGLDMARHRAMQERAERLIAIAKEEARSSGLSLKIVSAEFTLDGRSAIVQCAGKVRKKALDDFRRQLAKRMRCRVTLQTVGPRDHAKVLGGYGVCGEPRCCGRFLTEFQAVSIRMAKGQSISMAPSNITGMCGRLRCCLSYEHETYKEEAKLLPKLKSWVKTDRGVGRIVDFDILKGEVVVEIPPDGPRRDRQRFRYAAEDVEIVPREK